MLASKSRPLAEFASKSVDKLQMIRIRHTQLHPTLNAEKPTTERTRSPLGMILFFTSQNCTWCDIVKRMLEDELNDFSIETDLYEVDIERHEYIAEAYGVMMVPTLITGNNTLSGVPTETDLRTFILQSFPGSYHIGDEPSRYRVLSGMQKILQTQRVQNESKILENLSP